DLVDLDSRRGRVELVQHRLELRVPPSVLQGSTDRLVFMAADALPILVPLLCPVELVDRLEFLDNGLVDELSPNELRGWPDGDADARQRGEHLNRRRIPVHLFPRSLVLGALAA